MKANRLLLLLAACLLTAGILIYARSVLFDEKRGVLFADDDEFCVVLHSGAFSDQA